MDIVLGEKCLNDLIKLTYQLTGITIAPNRNSMVEGRLRKRVTALKLPNYEAYVKLIKSDRDEQVRFIDLMTTNETYFYRTPRIWDYVENTLLPAWFDSNPNTVFSAWSAAASSGAEAHTLGILCEAFKEKNPSFRYQITGTDISERMVGLCQAGQYSGRSIASFRKARPALFKKFMQRSTGEYYEVTPEIKSRLKFQQHNLFKPLTQREQFSLVLIRNVLIYFEGPDQEQVLSLIERRMAHNGVLVIGESESLAHVDTNFRTIEPLVYRLISGAELRAS